MKASIFGHTLIYFFSISSKKIHAFSLGISSACYDILLTFLVKTGTSEHQTPFTFFCTQF